VKIKENGLREGHPEKEGVLVNLSDLVSEIKQRLKRKADLDSMTKEAEGLRVVGGIRGEPEKSELEKVLPEEVLPEKVVPVLDAEKPAPEALSSQEATETAPPS
jgi:histidyl-tRNA synthetase